MRISNRRYEILVFWKLCIGTKWMIQKCTRKYTQFVTIVHVCIRHNSNTIPFFVKWTHFKYDALVSLVSLGSP